MLSLQKDRQVHVTVWKWGGDLGKEFAMKHLGSTPSDDSPIYKKHFIEATQHHGTPGFVPQWKGQHGPSVITPDHKCINPTYVSVHIHKWAFISVDIDAVNRRVDARRIIL